VKQALERRLGVVFGIALTLLFLIGVVQSQTVVKLAGADRDVMRISETLGQLAATHLLVIDAEAGMQGYAMTGDGGYLGAYRTAFVRVPQRVQNLRKLTAGDPSQQKNLDVLASLVATQLADVEKVHEAQKQGARAAASRLDLPGSNRKAADDLRQAMSGMEDEERRLLAQRIAAARVSAREATLITTLGSVLAFWLLIVAGLVIHRYIAERRGTRVAQALSTQLLKHMAEGVCLSDESGTILYANPAGEALFGYGPGRLIGHNLTLLGDFYTGDGDAHLLDQIHEQLRALGAWKGELAGRRRDRTPLSCYTRISGLEISGKLLWISVLEDITERKEIEERLASRREKLESALEGVGAS
jgi:PAS domain S-box-containing protein